MGSETFHRPRCILTKFYTVIMCFKVFFRRKKDSMPVIFGRSIRQKKAGAESIAKIIKNLNKIKMKNQGASIKVQFTIVEQIQTYLLLFDHVQFDEKFKFEFTGTIVN